MALLHGAGLDLVLAIYGGLLLVVLGVPGLALRLLPVYSAREKWIIFGWMSLVHILSCFVGWSSQHLAARMLFLLGPLVTGLAGCLWFGIRALVRTHGR